MEKNKKEVTVEELRKTAFDAVKDKDIKLDDSIRNKIKEICGGEWNPDLFKDNRNSIFAVVREAMPAAMQAGLAGKLDSLVEYHDTKMGDKPVFWVKNSKIYPCSIVSRGNGVVDRKRIYKQNLTIETDTVTVSFYDEFDNFMAGKMSLSELTQTAMDSFENYVGQLISDTIYNSYDVLKSDYAQTGTFDASKLSKMMVDVKKATGATKLMILGTELALKNVVGIFGHSDREIEMANGMGYYDTYDGAKMYCLPQATKPGSDDYAVDNNFIIVLPADERIVKVLFEGEPILVMEDESDRNDYQISVTYGRRIGAKALTVTEGRYGLFRFA